ncbi:MAG: hypothetical protein Kow00108_04090 [Calditrichia bacterium]
MKKVFIFLIIGGILVSFLVAQGGKLPPKVLAVISAKIINYIENLPGKSISVVYAEDDKTQKNDVKSEIEKLGYSVNEFAESDCANVTGDIVIIMSNVSPDALKTLLGKNKLIISENQVHTEKGVASFSVVNVAGKPQIIANIDHIKQTGLKVSGKLFRVVTKSND